MGGSTQLIRLLSAITQPRPTHPGGSGVNISRRAGGRREAKVPQVGSTDGCLWAGGVKFKVRGGDIKPLKGRRRRRHCHSIDSSHPSVMRLSKSTKKVLWKGHQG